VAAVLLWCLPQENKMWSELWIALALVLVIEGMLPAMAPDAYRRAMQSLCQMDSRAIRRIGMGSMIAGAVLFYFLKN
jgi:uncharacterized protein YjeT (DUF2065 family)